MANKPEPKPNYMYNTLTLSIKEALAEPVTPRDQIALIERIPYLIAMLADAQTEIERLRIRETDLLDHICYLREREVR